MKTSWLTIVLLVFAASRIQGQGSQSGPSAIAGQGTVPAQDTPYAVVERGANNRVWQRTTYETRADGKQIPHIHKYTELSTGLNYWDSTASQWVDSQEEINILPNGTTAATQGQHQAYFPGDIYQGVVELVTPDGIHLQSQPLGLSYDDGTNTVLIAILTNSIGQLVSSNQVIYTNAFTGLNADLACTYRKSGFECDVVLREQPLAPEAYGLDPQTSRLELLTEFFNTPEPVETTSGASKSDVLSDTTLIFGTMTMGRGKAFVVGDSTSDDARKPSFQIPVYKSWLHLQGRTLLVEEVPYRRISSQLQTLPVPANAASSASSAGSVMHKVSATQLLPPARVVQASTNRVQLAKTHFSRERGVVLDYYVAINSDETNYTFQGDTTYYVSGDYNLSGTTTFEGGTVIKLDGSGQINIDVLGTINCKTGPYRPAVFTSINDNSVGLPIGSGSPAFGDVTCFLNVNSTNITLHDLRFSYAWYAALDQDPDFCPVAKADIWNCQFENVGMAVYGYNIGLHNVLIGRPITYFEVPAVNVNGVSLVAENVTADGGMCFALDDYSDSWTAALTNCLVTGQLLIGGNPPETLLTNDTVWLASPSSPVYQTVGGGSFYLATNTYRNIGTTNISRALLAELRQKTTYPPIVYNPAIISTNLTFSPQAQRDTNSNPDLGYHYDPLDYAVSENLVTNATVTINPGTAIAVFGISTWTCGFGLTSGAQLICHGLATNLNRIVEYSTVQEQGTNTGWGMPYNGLVSDAFGAATQIVINCSFTDWSVLAQDAPHLCCCSAQPLTLQNCQFHGGLLDLNTTFALMNCLLERVDGELFPFDGNIPVIRNNLFYGGTFDFYPGVTNAVVKDTLFDQTTIVEDLTGWGYDGGYNAFVTNYDRMLPPFSSDVILSNSPAYQVGALGNFYLPTNSLLINAGSTTADQVGLYHFTTQTNQVKETNSIVDIGYHYVAVDNNRIPIDSNGDGIPDYLEDANGNGIFDQGDLGEWKISTFGLGGVNALQVFTPLK
jgi:alkylated DNA nucleotide flippase Atl1